ncbi:MAG: hypothetical protein IEMM0007_0675 [bacterium]|nr:MAG: hypothetical protein IEMM0007_0675 [bacterium]
MKLRPLHDRVLLRVEKEEKTTAGIIIPDTAKERPKEGVIVAVGPGYYEEPKDDNAAGKVIYLESRRDNGYRSHY